MNESTKTIRCQLCGEAIEVGLDIQDGQHVLCPYCQGKFSCVAEAERTEKVSPESLDGITEADLRHAIAECRKDTEKNRYYSKAPEGAKLYIGLIFYGEVFGAKVNVEKYMAAFTEIEPELKVRDLDYLIEHENDKRLVEYFNGLKSARTGQLVTGRKRTQVLPKVGILKGKSPVDFHVYYRDAPVRVKASEPAPAPGLADKLVIAGEKNVEALERRRAEKELVGKIVGLGFLIAALVAVALVGFFMWSSWNDSRIAEQQQIEANNQKIAKENARRVKISEAFGQAKREAIGKQKEVAGQVEMAIKAVKDDSSHWSREVNRIVVEQNSRSCTTQARGGFRFNKAERTMAVMKSSVIADLYSRYAGEEITKDANEFHDQVLRKMGAKKPSECDESEAAAIEALGDSYFEKLNGKAQVSFDEWNAKLIARRDALRELGKRLQAITLSDEDTNESGLASATSAINRLLADDAITGPIGLRTEQAVRSALAKSSEDEFVGAGEQTSESLSVANLGRQIATEVRHDDEMREKKFGKKLRKDSDALDEDIPVRPDEDEDDLDDAGDAVPPKRIVGNVGSALRRGDSDRRNAVTSVTRKGARTKCKFTGGCTQFAERGHNFCEKHECHSFGCKQMIHQLEIPRWIFGERGFNYVDPKYKKGRKLEAMYCRKHLCARVCPQNRKIVSPWTFVFDRDNDEIVDILYCNNERLAKGKFCIKHACKVNTCGGSITEDWHPQAGSRDTPSGWRFLWLSDWFIESGIMCRAHSNVDPETVPERTGSYAETEGDRERKRRGK